MATRGPAANAHANAHVRRQNNTIGITFGFATAAVVLGLSLATGGAAALTAGFFVKSLGLSALTGLIFGAFAQAAADGHLPSRRGVHIVRSHHIPTVRTQRRARFGAQPVLSFAQRWFPPLHSPAPHVRTTATTPVDRTFTPAHTAQATTRNVQHTSRPAASASTGAVHRPAMHKSNH